MSKNRKRDVVAEAEATGVEMDKPVVITYDNGEQIVLPTWREMAEQEQQLRDEFDELWADPLIREMFRIRPLEDDES